MKLYRVRQFFWAVISKIKDEDIMYIEKYLEKVEKELFLSLSVSEQKHSIRVAQKVEELIKVPVQTNLNEIDKDRLIKVALLHDIGKKEKALNVIDKSVLVISNKITKGKIRKLINIKKIDVYYNHSEKGYKILKEFDRYNERFLFLVRNHHNNDIIGDTELDLLRRADELC